MTVKNDVRHLPNALVEVALVDGLTAAVTGGMSLSWWLEEVRAKRAPQPAIRAPRCTRWRLADVAAFWAEFAATSAADLDASARVVDKARHASAKAREARLAQGGA